MHVSNVIFEKPGFKSAMTKGQGRMIERETALTMQQEIKYKGIIVVGRQFYLKLGQHAYLVLMFEVKGDSPYVLKTFKCSINNCCNATAS